MGRGSDKQLQVSGNNKLLGCYRHTCIFFHLNVTIALAMPPSSCIRLHVADTPIPWTSIHPFHSPRKNFAQKNRHFAHLAPVTDSDYVTRRLGQRSLEYVTYIMWSTGGLVYIGELTLTTLEYFCRPTYFFVNIFVHGDQRFFRFEIIINVLDSSFRFIWIPMLWVYGLPRIIHF